VSRGFPSFPCLTWIGRRSWIASRYHARMAAGDLVFYWMGGPSNTRGVYGWGHIVTAPDRSVPGEPPKVRVRCDKRLSQHIGVDEIKRNPKLANLMILNLPIGTNFQINSD
jgi:hypothetical protein